MELNIKLVYYAFSFNKPVIRLKAGLSPVRELTLQYLILMEA